MLVYQLGDKDKNILHLLKINNIQKCIMFLQKILEKKR